MHQVLQLFDELRGFRYPPEVKAPPRILPKTAFFPGGYGLWNTVAGRELPQWPEYGVMVLGHNFSSVKEWHDIISPNNGDILDKGTWLHLLSLLDRAGIRREQCFFTNAYMGLGDKLVGDFSGAKNEDFVEQCESFFHIQAILQQPRLVLALGLPVHKFLSKVSSAQGKLATWGSTLKRTDNSTVGPVVGGVGLNFCSEDFSTVVVALVHTSNHPAPTCVGIRQYRNWSGDDAELAMINEAMKLAGFQTWQLVCDDCGTESFLFSCHECISGRRGGNSYRYNSLVTGVVVNDHRCPMCDVPVTKWVCPSCSKQGRLV